MKGCNLLRPCLNFRTLYRNQKGTFENSSQKISVQNLDKILEPVLILLGSVLRVSFEDIFPF